MGSSGVEAVDRKQKIRDRYKGVDASELEAIPAKAVEGFGESTSVRRVAAYVRVSTDNDEQTSSYELQKNYYTEYIKAQPGWEFVGIYGLTRMNEEYTSTTTLTEQTVENERDARTEKLQNTFSYDGYQVVRKELFAHLRDPAIVIRKDSITFNTACITGLEDVVYVHVMFNNDLKRIVVRGCDENDKDALRWCIAKPDKRKSRKMSCKPFAESVYKEMDWDSECRYKVLGYRITFEGETLYVFDLLVPEIFHERQKRKEETVAEQPADQETKPVDTRKGFYPDDIAGTFGVPVEEHLRESEVRQMDGYVSMGVLTGRTVPDTGLD